MLPQTLLASTLFSALLASALPTTTNNLAARGLAPDGVICTVDAGKGFPYALRIKFANDGNRLQGCRFSILRLRFREYCNCGGPVGAYYSSVRGKLDYEWVFGCGLRGEAPGFEYV